MHKKLYLALLLSGLHCWQIQGADEAAEAIKPVDTTVDTTDFNQTDINNELTEEQQRRKALLTEEEEARKQEFNTPAQGQNSPETRLQTESNNGDQEGIQGLAGSKNSSSDIPSKNLQTDAINDLIGDSTTHSTQTGPKTETEDKKEFFIYLKNRGDNLINNTITKYSKNPLLKEALQKMQTQWDNGKEDQNTLGWQLEALEVRIKNITSWKSRMNYALKQIFSSSKSTSSPSLKPETPQEQAQRIKDETAELITIIKDKPNRLLSQYAQQYVARHPKQIKAEKTAINKAEQIANNSISETFKKFENNKISSEQLTQQINTALTTFHETANKITAISLLEAAIQAERGGYRGGEEWIKNQLSDLNTKTGLTKYDLSLIQQEIENKSLLDSQAIYNIRITGHLIYQAAVGAAFFPLGIYFVRNAIRLTGGIFPKIVSSYINATFDGIKTVRNAIVNSMKD